MSDFQTFFFVYQVKGVYCLLSKTKLLDINLKVRFLQLIIVFWSIENDDIVSSKSYTVTTSEISFQQKL